MTFALVGLLAAFFALYFWRERSFAKQHTEQEQAFRLEREAWASERRDLNNRIQVPEAAPFMDTEEQEPQFVPFDDDQGFFNAEEDLNG